MVKTQHNVVIKCFCCDLDRKSTYKKFYELLTCDGNIHQKSCIDIPQPNGVIERKYCHIIENMCFPLLFASVSEEFWGKSVITNFHGINITSSYITSSLSSFKKFYNFISICSSLKIFGYTCFLLLLQLEDSKLSSCSTICVFLGYGDKKTGYSCYDPQARKFYVSHIVESLEHNPFYSLSS